MNHQSTSRQKGGRGVEQVSSLSTNKKKKKYLELPDTAEAQQSIHFC
jgi:hypothetical protein